MPRPVLLSGHSYGAAASHRASHGASGRRAISSGGRGAGTVRCGPPAVRVLMQQSLSEIDSECQRAVAPG